MYEEAKQQKIASIKQQLVIEETSHSLNDSFPLNQSPQKGSNLRSKRDSKASNQEKLPKQTQNQNR